MPSSLSGPAAPLVRPGTRRPTPTATDAAPSPVRRNASQVPSAASHVRRRTSASGSLLSSSLLTATRQNVASSSGACSAGKLIGNIGKTKEASPTCAARRLLVDELRQSGRRVGGLLLLSWQSSSLRSARRDARNSSKGGCVELGPPRARLRPISSSRQGHPGRAPVTSARSAVRSCRVRRGVRLLQARAF
jgi:hypothetical protein